MKTKRRSGSLARLGMLCLLASVLVSQAGLGCKQPPPRLAVEPITLEYWGVWDEPSYFSEAIQAFTAQRPNVTIRYRRLRFDEYQDLLIDALAEDRGPDIFSLHNTWINEYRSKIDPAPGQVTLPLQYVSGTIREEVVYEVRNFPMTSVSELRNNYVDAVAEDVLWSDSSGQTRIYGLPLSVDTLVLYSNRDLLNAAGIPEPPREWREFQDQVTRLTRVDSEGDFLVSGAAMGTAENVQRSTDILSLLMMQNGAQMATGSSATFDQVPEGLSRSAPPGQEALRFYTDFAIPIKQVYTWNADQPDSLEAFAEGEAAFFFGYAYHLPEIRARAPQLSLTISPVPQIQGNPEVNFANYWVETVSAKSEHPEIAWGFLDFLSRADNVTSYLDAANKPTALRSLILTQSEDADMAPFVSQLLTARSWYRGKDAMAAEQAMKDMIESVVDGSTTVEDAVSFGAQLVTQTYR